MGIRVLIKKKRGSEGRVLGSANLKWENRFYVDAYLLGSQGASLNKLAKAIKVDPHTVSRWFIKRPSFREAYERGKEWRVKSMNPESEDFIEFVYGRLPPKLRRWWKKIQQWELTDTDGTNFKARNLIMKMTKQQRQHLFIHALVNSSFNVSNALKSAHLTYDMYRRWVERDKDFIKMLNEIHVHKRNFVSGSLFRLIGNGSEAATIFAARNLLKDEGFADTKNVEVSGRIDHAHYNMVEILKHVSPEAKKEFLRAIRKQEQGQLEDVDKPNITITRITQRMGIDDEEDTTAEVVEAQEVDGD